MTKPEHFPESWEGLHFRKTNDNKISSELSWMSVRFGDMLRSQSLCSQMEWMQKNNHGYIQESLLGKKIMIEPMLLWHNVGVCNCNLLRNSWTESQGWIF